MRLSVVFTTHNEEAAIRQTLVDAVKDLEAQSLDDGFEIVVVDNASEDRTAAIVEEFVADHPAARLVRHPRNLGYAMSTLTALREARGDVVAVVDGDGQFTAEDLPAFLDRLRDGADLVYGWRTRREDTRVRIVITYLLNTLARVWLGWPHHDINCGYRVATRAVARSVETIRPTNFPGPELWVRARQRGWRVAEVPVRHFARVGGRSTHSVSALPAAIVAGLGHLLHLRRELRGG